MSSTTDNGPKNKDRRRYALQTLEFYCREKYKESPREMEFEGIETRASDLLADIMHLVAANDRETDVDDVIDRLIRLARMHFDAEHNNPEEE